MDRQPNPFLLILEFEKTAFLSDRTETDEQQAQQN
jgi:hypothetical protein